jgi:hypothetical protein
LKKTLHKKRADGVAGDIGPEFKPQYCKKTKKKPKAKKGWLCGSSGRVPASKCGALSLISNTANK